MVSLILMNTLFSEECFNECTEDHTSDFIHYNKTTETCVCFRYKNEILSVVSYQMKMDKCHRIMIKQTSKGKKTEL